MCGRYFARGPFALPGIQCILPTHTEGRCTLVDYLSGLTVGYCFGSVLGAPLTGSL